MSFISIQAVIVRTAINFAFNLTPSTTLGSWLVCKVGPVMTTARRALIAPESTPFYHVINRCVRRAYLCGQDTVTGQRYEHRRCWIVDRVKALSTIFYIDVCALR